MRDVDHMSQRAIARQIGLSESFVRDILKGRRNISSGRAVRVGFKEISPAVSASPHARGLPFRMWTFIKGGGARRPVRPMTGADASKIGRYMNRVKRGKHQGFGIVRKELPASDFSVRTAGGRIDLEDDPDALAELDEAGLLDVENIIEGVSP
jgi:hypothetical protein